MISNRIFYGVLLLCLITYVLGMTLVPLMDIDATQYASISREMLENHSYLQVYDLGYDYLDKPPMLFWLSAASMQLFGVHDWAYRLPSLLFALLALYATYRLALLFYEKTIAQLSVLVLATVQAFFLMIHDVRCDTMLMGWVALSLWQLAAWYDQHHWKNLIGAALAIAGGMMTKGPIALMVPVFAFVPHLILRREWKQLFRWEYLVVLVMVALLLVPMSIGLYQQFDQHPGKIISGRPIESGLRFFYWTQSFGRYTGENQYREMGHFTFLLENMLWSFLPWILCFLPALFLAVKNIVQQKGLLKPHQEWITAGGFLFTYCILARSQAQLPHYIFVVYPLAAILTANFLYRMFFTQQWKRWQRPLLVVHAFLFILLWLAVNVLLWWPFPGIPVWVGILSGVGLLVFMVLLFKPGKGLPVFILYALFTVIGVNIFLNTAFYPNLLQYQLGNSAAKYINNAGLDKSKVVAFQIDESRALHFYANHLFRRTSKAEELVETDIVITRKEGLSALQYQFPAMRTIFEGEYFGVSQLTLPFLDPEKRGKEVIPYVIVKLDGKP